MSIPLAEIEKGARSEERFFDAATVRLHNTPQWLIGITRADIELDLRGIDAMAYVLYPGESRAERIPIQVKSSWGGTNHHRAAHPELAKANIVYIVILDDLNDVAIRRILYAELDKRRSRKIRYERILRKIVGDPLSLRAERRRQNYYAADMRDLRYSQETPASSEPPPIPSGSEFEERTIQSRLLRWLSPTRDDSDWKPWSWMIPSHW